MALTLRPSTGHLAICRVHLETLHQAGSASSLPKTSTGHELAVSADDAVKGSPGESSGISKCSPGSSPLGISPAHLRARLQRTDPAAFRSSIYGILLARQLLTPGDHQDVELRAEPPSPTMTGMGDWS
ncbi:MAG: hypothetical protein ACRD1T_27810, partial [Acidimicrobiia bacterium]